MFRLPILLIKILEILAAGVYSYNWSEKCLHCALYSTGCIHTTRLIKMKAYVSLFAENHLLPQTTKLPNVSNNICAVCNTLIKRVSENQTFLEQCMTSKWKTYPRYEGTCEPTEEHLSTQRHVALTQIFIITEKPFVLSKWKLYYVSEKCILA